MRRQPLASLYGGEPVEWPPNEWDEMDFYRDPETRLPLRLHPFEMNRPEADGPWSVSFGRGDDRRMVAEGMPDIFMAFRAMLSAYEEWLPSRPISRVYFIGTELRAGAMVKIGVSRFPEKRLAQLQTAHSDQLRIFATRPGDKADEERYHRRWSVRRRRGEWFTLGDCIIREIERLKGQP